MAAGRTMDNSAGRSRPRPGRSSDRRFRRRATGATLAQGGKKLAQLNARSRHKFRIQTKKLRYATEFFCSLYGSKRAAKRRKQFHPALERLQDGLGDLNDIAVHEERVSALGIRGRRSNRSRAFAAGLLTGREDARIEPAMTAAKNAYADLAKVRPFWR